MRLSSLMAVALFVSLFGSAFVPKTTTTNSATSSQIVPLLANPDSTQNESTTVSTEETQETALVAENVVGYSASNDTQENKEALRRQAFAEALLETAKSLEGIRYKYAGKSPKTGFDCSGFVSYVFKQHGIDVPVSSRLYDTVGETIPLEEAQPGDILCFTGTDPKMKRTGHVGIVVENQPGQPVKFIHASSGKAYSITYSNVAPGKHYSKRFRSVRRIAIPDTF